jgi:hypothetical protein
MSIVCIYTPVYTWMPTRLRAAPHFNARSSGVPGGWRQGWEREGEEVGMGFSAGWA